MTPARLTSETAFMVTPLDVQPLVEALLLGTTDSMILVADVLAITVLGFVLSTRAGRWLSVMGEVAHRAALSILFVASAHGFGLAMLELAGAVVTAALALAFLLFATAAVLALPPRGLVGATGVREVLMLILNRYLIVAPGLAKDAGRF
jgi:hypothetical protein